MAVGKTNILLVEDEVILALSEQQQLEKMGYAVHHVINGESAVKTALNPDSAYNLILMDINLGSGIDGTQAAEQILKEKDIPIVFLTSHTEPEVVEKTEKISSYGYVVKDSGPTVLNASIKMALKLYEAYRRYNQRNQELYTLATKLEESNEELISTEKELRIREAALTESDNRFRSVLKLVPDMISIHDPDMNILYSNWRGFADVPESRRRINTKCYKTYRDLDHICPDCLAKTVLETGEPLQRETELPEGMWVDIRAIPVLDENNNVTMFVEWVRDITKRKQVEKDLIHQNSLLESIINGTPDILAIQNPDLTVERYNEAGYNFLGKTPEEVKGKKCYELIGFKSECEGCATKKALLSKKLESHEKYIPSMDIFLDCRSNPVLDKNGNVVQVVEQLRDITKRKKVEERLRDSEATVRKKLNAIMEPDGDIGTLNLADIIDQKALQSMMEDFYSFSGIGSALVDMSGKVLVAVGWQDICTKFHRTNPDTAKNCLESDIALSEGVPLGTFKAYHCKNNMWDMVTPIEVGGKHLGNMFLGQFLFKDEVPDYELFRKQARRYGFDEAEYLAALDRVPRWGRETVNSVMTFYSKLADMISSLSYSKLKLSRDISEQRKADEEIKRQLSEKELLLKEVHHRIKNSVASIESLLSMQARTSSNPEVRKALQEALSRVTSIRVVYEKLLFGKDYKEISVKDYTESLIDSLVAVFPESKNIIVKKHITDFTLSSKKVIPVGIIINELLTNVFKYAFRGRNEGLISIELSREASKVTLIIQDNGIGIGESDALTQSSGFGITIVKMLAEQLKGSYSITNNNGTRSVLFFGA